MDTALEGFDVHEFYSDKIYQPKSLIKLNAQDFKLLNSGNFGIVYTISATECIKVIKNVKDWQETLREYEIFERVAHKLEQKGIDRKDVLLAYCICLGEFHEFGQRRIGIVMPLYKSGLKNYLKDELSIKPTDERDAGRKEIMRQMALAVHQLHVYTNIIHGDIALRNFLVDQENRPILTDFGLSHRLKKRTLDNTYYGVYETENIGQQPVNWLEPRALQGMLKKAGMKLDAKSDAYMLGASYMETIVYSNRDHPAFESYLPFTSATKPLTEDPLRSPMQRLTALIYSKSLPTSHIEFCTTKETDPMFRKAVELLTVPTAPLRATVAEMAGEVFAECQEFGKTKSQEDSAGAKSPYMELGDEPTSTLKKPSRLTRNNAIVENLDNRGRPVTKKISGLDVTLAERQGLAQLQKYLPAKWESMSYKELFNYHTKDGDLIGGDEQQSGLKVSHIIAKEATSAELEYSYKLLRKSHYKLDLEKTTKKGDTVLSRACQDPSPEGTKKIIFLVGQGASVDTTNDEGKNIGHQTASSGSIESLEFVTNLVALRRTKWKLSSKSSYVKGESRTMLHYAVGSPYDALAKVKFLVSHSGKGVDVSAYDYYGFTALHEVCYLMKDDSWAEMVELLIEASPKALFMVTSRFNVTTAERAARPIDIALLRGKDHSVDKCTKIMADAMEKYAYLK